MSLVSVGAQSGMHGFLASMGRNKAGKMTANSSIMDQAQKFIGPASGGAPTRMKEIGAMLGKLTQLPSYLKEYGRLTNMDPQEQFAVWEAFVDTVANKKNNFQMAGFGNTMPFDSTYSGYGFAPPSHEETMMARFEMAKSLTSQLTSPSPEFSQEMAMSAILPIAQEMIPNTVCTKAFITDMALGEPSKAYYMKRRYKAYQQGLAEEASGKPPSEVATYTPLLVTPTEWKRSTTVDLKWIEMMQFDVPADQLSDGGRELQVLFDNAFFRSLDFLVPNNGSAPAEGSTINGFTVDSTQTCMMLEAGRNPQVEDINFANQLLRNRGYNPDLIITSPFELGALMSEQAILMAYAYGTREVQETGMVGTLVGDAVAWTPNLWQGGNPSSLVIWVVDSDELARIVLGQPIGLFPDFRSRRMEFELYCRLAMFFRNTNACCKIVCNNADAGIV